MSLVMKNWKSFYPHFIPSRQHWLLKRRRKGLPLIRHFQPPLWEEYQQQVKLWEESVARTNTRACKENILSMEKPPMFAFCLKPLGLEVISRGYKQRSHRRFPTYGHYQSVPADQDGLHDLNEEKTVLSDRSNEHPDASPSFHNSTRLLLPGDGGGSLIPFNKVDVSDWNHYPEFSRKKQGASPDSLEIVHRLDMVPPNQNTTQQHDDCPDFAVFRLMDAECDAQQARGLFRFMEAQSEAQKACKAAKLKWERAQRLHYEADMAVHKAAVALMTAEIVKASDC